MGGNDRRTGDDGRVDGDDEPVGDADGTTIGGERTRQLFKGAGIVFVGLVLELVVSFVAKLLIARYLGPTSYGAVAIGLTVMTATSILVLVGLDSGIGRYLPRYDDPAVRRGVLKSALEIALPVALITGAALFLGADLLAVGIFHDPAVAPVIRVFSLVLPFTVVFRLAIGGVQGMGHSLPKVLIQNLTLPITRFLLIAVVLAAGLGAVGTAWAYGLAYVLAGTLGAYYFVTRTPLFDDVEARSMHRELLAFSAPLMITAAMFQVLAHIDTFILGYFDSTDIVGVYNVVYPLAQLLTTMLAAFGFIAMPIISSQHAEESTAAMRRTYQLSAKWIFLATLPVFLVVVLFPRMSIRVTFGAEYDEGALALAVLAVGFFTHAIVGPNGNALTSVGRTKLIMYDNIAVATTNLALNFLLIPEHGLLGAAIATTVSYAILNVLYTTQLYRVTGIQPFTAGMVRASAIAIGTVAVMYWATTTFFEVTLPVLLVGFGVFMVLYGVIVLRFGGIEDEELLLLWSVEDRFGVDLGPLKRVAEKIVP